MNHKLNVVTINLALIAILIFNACTSTPAVERGVVVGEGLLKADTLFSQP